MKRILLLSFALAAGRLAADTAYPPPSWRDAPDPIASPDAYAGGEIVGYAGPYPQSFNYYLDNNVFSATLFGWLYETLLTSDPLTADYTPGLAKSWTISEDKKTFTFTLDERARWSDGRPITAEDVVWTFNAIMDPKNLTGVHKVALENIEPPVALSSNTVRFTAKDVHWRNLGAVGGFSILPKHAFEGRDFNKINVAFPVVSGPYRLGELREGVSARLERRDDWWARGDARYRGTANFDAILYRFFAERENAFEAFKKGRVDIFPVYTSRIWVNETSGERFDNEWIVKQRVRNRKPIGFQGFAMNMRRPPFDDARVRQAMAHLLNRERLNRTLMYDQYFLHRSFYEDLYDPEHPCENPVYAFDKEKARALLTAAGWTPNPETGLLEKDGQPFVFRFLSRDPSTEKFLVIYAEDLRDVGIQMDIDRKDWAAWSRDMDAFNFDMTWAAWGAGLHKDPEGMWASKEAERSGGNNIAGFKDEEVDRLIEAQRTAFDLAERNAICRRIDAILTREVPYVLLWNIDATRLLYWNKFGTPPTVLSKYGDEHSAYAYWWLDEDAAADLEDGMSSERALVPRPDEVRFDDAFKPSE